jgi:hypothetical protein
MQRLSSIAQACLSVLRAIPPALAWIASRPQAALNWLGCFRVELWRVEGEERTSGLPLSLLCAAAGTSKNYVLDLIVKEPYLQRRLGRFWLWNLAAAAGKAGADCSLIVVDTDHSHLKFADSDDWYLVPLWLFGEADLPYDAHVSSKRKSELRRRIRRQGYEFEVTRDRERFDDFYYNMYVPYIKETHGHCAQVESYKALCEVFRQSDLLLLKNQDGFIAGTLMRYAKAEPYLWESGIRDGNRQYVQDGAAAALYHFCLEYLHGKGYQKVYFGWSRAFLRDGVLQFKKSLSQRIADSYQSGFALRVLSYTPAVNAFLVGNPFIHKRQGHLYAAVFVDGDKPLCAEEMKRIDKEYFHPGLARLYIYLLPGAKPTPPEAVPAEIAERMEIRCGK